MTTSEVIQADLTYVNGRFERDVRIEVGADGVIAAVGAIDAEPTRRLAGRAILPGLVNAHCHAFQRGLRGRGETFPEGAGNFWTWREAMYELVEAMDAERLHALAVRAYREMLAAGITTVGEFHYLHHDATLDGYAFDEVMLDAARTVGIRLVLLEAYYRTGGIDAPLAGGQRRFATSSPEAYWGQIDRLAERVDPATQSLGVVAHSIRAAGIDEIAALHAEAERRAMVFHMHVEEQPGEIEDCVRRYHQPPMALLNERLEISPRFTAVHCTHTAAEDMGEFLGAGGNVCICPLTEANLADGLADVRTINRRYGRICLGTDSNARISMIEEMRWLEYGQRLRTQTRGVCTDEAGRTAEALLACATLNGAHALGIRAGAIEKGRAADFVTVDLGRAELAGWTEETLLASLVLGAGDGVLDEVCVGGRWVRGEPASSRLGGGRSGGLGLGA